VTFLIPGALVCAQLYRFMPVDGAIYVWTHRALGPLLGFFAGFCAWFPGVLVPLATCDSMISLIQGIGVENFGPRSGWLMVPWQEGLFVICALVLVGVLSLLPLKAIMRAAKIIILLYLVGIFLVGLAGAAWLLAGHAPRVSFVSSTLGLSGQNLVLYGVIVLALLGIEVPLNMAAESRKPDAAMPFLRWGWLVVLFAYLLGTFGVMVVVPPSQSSNAYSALTAVHLVFGPLAATLVGCIFVLFFFTTTIIYNLTFARILFVSALDHRLPPSLAKVNRFAAPYRAIILQIAFVILITFFTYFLAPLLYAINNSSLSLQVYNVSQATTTIIWCISMIILFLDLPVLLYRFRSLLAKKRDQLLTAPWVLYLAAIVGGIASMLGIWTTLTQSWEPDISNRDWAVYVGVSSLVCLVIGLIGSAYPRLLTSLNEQTAAARENARLYNELSIAYEKLNQADQMKDTFLTTASHELRTPLTIVQGYLELLGEMEDADLETRRSFLTKARRACDELVLLQANIMDASRVKFDAAALVFNSIPLKETVSSVVDLFEPLIIQQNRQVQVDIGRNITVWADETRIKQVLRNLLSNALRYSPYETPIRITAEQEANESMVRIHVIDKGAGVPPEKQEEIFEKFVRLERDMNGTIRGSGLGLYITRQLVEAMNGRITVESSGINGEGSDFSFTIPIAKKAQTRPL
jgi:signal transduction histidine kinase